jgi:hypothetical protein
MIARGNVQKRAPVAFNQPGVHLELLARRQQAVAGFRRILNTTALQRIYA